MSGIKVQRIRVDLIKAEGRLRMVDPLKVAGFVNDLDKRGLKTPLTVSQLLANGHHRLVIGGHRFEAIRQLTELNPHEEAARKLRAKVDMIVKSEGLSLKGLATESGIKYGTFTNWMGGSQ